MDGLFLRVILQPTGQSSADRRAEFLSAFAERWDYEIPNDELIVGSQKFGFYHDWLWLLEPAEREKLAYRPNQGHIIVDYGRMLRLGVDGVRKQIELRPAAGSSLSLG